MPYTKTNWVDRVVQNPLTYTLRNNADGTVTLIPAEGTIVQSGTPITASVMNNLETQYDQIKALAQMTKLTLDNGYISNLAVDVDTVFASGFYYIGSAARAASTSLPVSTNLTMMVIQFTATSCIQVIYEMQTLNPRSWYRYGASGAWGLWIPIATYDASGKIPVANLPSAIKLTKDSGQAFDNATLGAEVTSFDQVTTAGFYYVGQGASGTGLANHPLGAGFVSNGFMIVLNIGIGYVFQQWTRIDGSTFTRVNYQGTWSAWKPTASTIQESWIAPALVNGWTSYSTYTAGYYKNNFGEVGLRGYLTGGTKAAGTILYTLPAGYRPSTNLRLQALVSGGSAAPTLLDVLTTGEVKLVYDISTYTYIALDGISFRVA